MTTAAGSNPRTASRGPRRRLWACERGAELVEFAFVFPTLLLVILGIIDIGFLFQRYEVVTNAAREGARVAILPDYEANINANVTARVNQYLNAGGLTPTDPVVVVTPPPFAVGAQCMTVRTVTVAYDNQFLFLGPVFGLMGGNYKTLHATSSMRSELAAEACP